MNSEPNDRRKSETYVTRQEEEHKSICKGHDLREEGGVVKRGNGGKKRWQNVIGKKNPPP